MYQILFLLYPVFTINTVKLQLQSCYLTTIVEQTFLPCLLPPRTHTQPDNNNGLSGNMSSLFFFFFFYSFYSFSFHCLIFILIRHRTGKTFNYYHYYHYHRVPMMRLIIKSICFHLR